MRLAAIDIGTNSTRILISEKKGSSFNTLLRDMNITRLGKDLLKSKKISDSSAKRTCDVLRDYKDKIDQSNVKKVRVIGTSALRQASNSNMFLEMVKRLTGLDVDVIDGEEEARLSFSGVASIQEFAGEKNYLLIIDIGGGSTEFILGNHAEGLKFIKSIEMGSVSVTERFNPNKVNLSDLNRYIDEELKKVLNRLSDYDLSKIIGLAGTITTLAAIDLRLDDYDRDKIHLHKLKLEKVDKILDILLNRDLEQRKKIIGLDPGRADIIVAGTAILVRILRNLNFNIITVSESDILDGIIYSMVDFC